MDDFMIEQINALTKKNDFDYLRAQDQIFVLYSRSCGTKYPAIDKNGFANVFTKLEYAQKCLEKNDGIDLEIKSFTPAEFGSYVNSWYRLGVVKFRLNYGTNDHCMEIKRDEFQPDSKAKMWDYANSSLNFYTIRYHQNRGNTDGSSQASARTLWSMICHVLPKSLLLAPFVYDGESVNDPVDDNCIHISAQSAAMVQKIWLEKQARGEDIAAGGAVLFYGGENYRFADASEEKGGKTMHPRTVSNQGHNFVPGFTDFAALEQIFGKKTRIGLFTYDELRQGLHDTVEGTGNAVEGLVLNPGDTNLLLTEKDIAAIEEEKGGTPKIYVDLTGGRKPEEDRPKAEEPEPIAAPEKPAEPESEQKQAKPPVTAEEKKPVKPAKPKRKAKAVTALVCGIVSVLSLGVFCVPEILAILFGILSYRDIRAGKTTGEGMAIAGFTMGQIALAILLGSQLGSAGLIVMILELAGALVWLLYPVKK